jgi:hypothetical protein
MFFSIKLLKIQSEFSNALDRSEIFKFHRWSKLETKSGCQVGYLRAELPESEQ